MRRLLYRGRYGRAVDVARNLFEADPAREDSKRLLILAYWRKSEQEEMSLHDRLMFIVQLMQFGVVEDWIAAEYFEHLNAVLDRDLVKLGTPGRIVLGMSTGRSGSTSLARLLSAQEGSYFTHEVPPIVYWPPAPEQVRFHVRRFQMLSRYYEFVGDVAHWWLNCRQQIRESFPDARFIGIKRDTDQTVASFERIKGSGAGSINHWHDHDGTYWSKNIWDPCYPVEDINLGRPASPEEMDAMRRSAVRAYVEEYNSRIESDDSTLQLEIDDLNDPGIVDRINQHCGTRLTFERVEANKEYIQDSHWQGMF